MSASDLVLALSAFIVLLTVAGLFAESAERRDARERNRRRRP